MKKLFLLIPCLFLLSCEEGDIYENNMKKGDRIRIKNTEIIATVINSGSFVYFYYEDDFGELHFDTLHNTHIEKVVDNP
jgi:hypothetical protein